MAHTNPQREIQWEGWELNIHNHSIEVTKLGESREYNFNDIVKVEHNYEYVFLSKYGSGNVIQIKFEIDNFLVIDEFDKYGEHLGSIGSHVFGEE